MAEKATGERPLRLSPAHNLKHICHRNMPSEVFNISLEIVKPILKVVSHPTHILQ
jgi:hypothetical protein